jgi:probable phosphoglycerate mutase
VEGDGVVTDVLLVRHGETVWHAENRYAGTTDVALNDRGRAQARALGAWARDAGLRGLWCSPLSRAHDTATAVAEATGLAPRVDARLVELGFGAAEGLTRAEMDARFPRARAAFEADPVAHHLPDGEDPRAAAARFVAALDGVAGAHGSDARVLVVAHTTVIRLALCALLGLPLSDYRRRFPRVDNTTLTEVRLGGGPPALLRFNATI